MTPQTLSTWRAEISSELSEARSGLTAGEAEQSEADQAAHAAHAEYRALQAAFAAVTNQTTRSKFDGRLKVSRAPLAPTIAIRLAEKKREMDAAHGRAARARGQLQELRIRVGELELALHQLDLVLEPAATEEAA